MSFVDAVKTVDTSSSSNTTKVSPQSNSGSKITFSKFLDENGSIRDIYDIKNDVKASIMVYSLANKTEEVFQRFILTSTTVQGSVAKQLQKTSEYNYFRFRGNNVKNLMMSGILRKHHITQGSVMDWAREFKQSYLTKWRLSQSIDKIITIKVGDKIYPIKPYSLNITTSSTNSESYSSFNMNAFIIER